MKYYAALVCLGLCSSLSQASQLSPYAKEETREIKAMSQAEINGYLAGKGMGFAKPAELNGYPGPKHVLDLSKELNLTETQVAQSHYLFNVMENESKKLGELLIEKEKDLEYLFASDSVNGDKLAEIITLIGNIKSEIRLAHLSSHIEQKKILTAEQVMLYKKHRGYQGDHSAHSAHNGHAAP